MMPQRDAIILRKHGATATLLPRRGGLLQQLKLVGAKSAREILWSDTNFSNDDNTWPQAGCPVMFPFAGRVWSDGQLGAYKIADQKYHLPLHGFAHQLPWEISQHSDDSCALLLRDSLSSQQQFPFAFQLSATYALSREQIAIDIAVTHAGALAPLASDTPMPVAVGLHPFFKVPIGSDTNWQGTKLQVPATHRREVTTDGNASPEQIGKTHAQEAITATHLRSAIYADLRTQAAQLLATDGTAYTISWHSDDIKYVVVWSKPEQGFFCMEPWMGLPDAPNRQETKKIAAGTTLRLKFAITLSD